MDRLIGILSLLLQADRVTAPYLAEKFEVSRRTIMRDIDTLSRAGIPVVTAQGAGGGISILEGYRVDRTLLTREDMRAILAGLEGLDSVAGGGYGPLMERMAPGEEPGPVRIDLAAWSRPELAGKFALLRRAIDGQRRVRFRYFAPGGESLREVEPGRLLFHWSAWYLWGWCRLRGDWRLFKLSRMAELAEGEPFPPREVPAPDLSNQRVFPERYRIRVLVAEEAIWRLVEEYGANSFRKLPDGRADFSFGFTDRDSALGWALSFGSAAEILEPPELRTEMARVCGELAERYRET